jgi:hypothetical protein
LEIISDSICLEVNMKKWIILSCLVSLQSSAVSLGTYRIYLDSENREHKFMLKNSSETPERCDLKFTYTAYYESGVEIKKLSAEEQVALSAPALERLRYSPRQFTVEPKSSQYVAFRYRRQISDESAEHRTYASFTCVKDDNRVKTGIKLKPTLMHSVPLVLRTGLPKDLDANLVFSQIKQQNNTISFRIELQGNRSVFGNINLVNAKGDLLDLLQQNVVIYPEMKYKDFVLPLSGFNEENMMIEFQETGEYTAKKQFKMPLKGGL